MTLPKLEGEIILSANTVLGTFAGSVITIPKGRYFLNSIGSGGATHSLLLEMKTQLDAGPGGTWTVTCDDNSDTSVGKVTIARNSNYTATWTSTSLRDALGFTGNLSTSSTATFTGANQAQYLYLPNTGRAGVMSPEAGSGAYEADHTLAIAPDGTLYALAYTTRNYDTLEFRTLKGSKTFTSLATVTNGALEKFYQDVIARALRVRFYKDRSADATFRTWRVEDAGHYDPQQVKEGWVGAEALFAIRWKVRETS
jgi:hypothetical protein